MSRILILYLILSLILLRSFIMVKGREGKKSISNSTILQTRHVGRPYWPLAPTLRCRLANRGARPRAQGPKSQESSAPTSRGGTQGSSCGGADRSSCEKLPARAWRCCPRSRREKPG